MQCVIRVSLWKRRKTRLEHNEQADRQSFMENFKSALTLLNLLSYDIGKYILQHIATDKHVDHG